VFGLILTGIFAAMGEPALKLIQGADEAATLLHPIRLRILERLGDEPQSATGLSHDLEMPRQKLNYHLRALERAGLAELFEERKRGNCTERLFRATARSYLISPEALGRIATDPANVQDRFSSAYLVAVAARTIRDVAVLRERAARAKKTLPTLTLQTQIRFASAKDRDAFATELANEVARLTAKYNDAAAQGGRLYEFFLGGYPTITKSVRSEECSSESPDNVTKRSKKEQTDDPA